ncbi:MAG: hypothetical protein ACJ72W_13570 [Actinoallomurus sp.]
MSWALREGVSLHPMPFGGAFVLDEARLAVRQIGSELTALLAGEPTASAGSLRTPATSAGPVGAEDMPAEGHSAPPPAGPADAGPAADATSSGVSPVLAAEIRLGVEEGWLIHQEETA